MIALYIFVALLALMFMVFVHELGHYIAGRALGFKINEFAVGIGPKIFHKTSKKTGIKYSLRMIPFGGFCNFEDEDGVENDAKKGKSDSFFAKKPWKRIIVLASGGIFNFICAWVLIAVFFTAYGNIHPVVQGQEFSCGTVQVLEAGDIVLEVNGQRLWHLVNPNQFGQLLNVDGGNNVRVLRDGVEMDLQLFRGKYQMLHEGTTYDFNDYGIKIIALAPIRLGFSEAIGQGFLFIFRIVGQLFRTIGGIFTGALGIRGTLGGPVMAVTSIVGLTQMSWFFVIYALCVLSANLAVFNLLPIPALDGSKIVFTGIEWVRDKPINRTVEGWIHVVGIVLMLGLALLMDLINFL